MAYKIVKSGDFRKRRNFSRIRNSYELKDLLEIQKKSYDWFIKDGIKEVFDDLFPPLRLVGILGSPLNKALIDFLDAGTLVEPLTVSTYGQLGSRL